MSQPVVKQTSDLTQGANIAATRHTRGDPQIREGLSALSVVGAQGEVDRPFRHQQAPPMPTMVPLSCYLNIRAAGGCNALLRDNVLAVTDVPHNGTQHFRRFTFSERQCKHQPRCSTQKNAPHCAASHTMSTHCIEARLGAHRAARRRLHRSAVPAATATASLLAPS